MLRGRDSDIAPDYPRIPHLEGYGSNRTPDDNVLTAKLPFEGTIQEKVDGANSGEGGWGELRYWVDR